MGISRSAVDLGSPSGEFALAIAISFVKICKDLCRAGCNYNCIIFLFWDSKMIGNFLNADTEAASYRFAFVYLPLTLHYFLVHFLPAFISWMAIPHSSCMLTRWHIHCLTPVLSGVNALSHYSALSFTRLSQIMSILSPQPWWLMVCCENVSNVHLVYSKSLLL